MIGEEVQTFFFYLHVSLERKRNLEMRQVAEGVSFDRLNDGDDGIYK